MEPHPFYPIRECPVCLSRDALLLHKIDYPSEKDRILPVQYRIIACRKCGMIYDDFDADESVFVSHYRCSGKYEMANTGGAGGRNNADLSRWQQIIDRVTPYLKSKDAAITDIGCGKGGLLQSFWETGYHNLTGVDASPGCIRFIQEHYSFPAVCCGADQYNPEHGSDLIVFAQILEHLFSCRSQLEALHHILKPGGLLYLELPDASGYLQYTKAPFYFFDQEHINHFQPGSVRNLLTSCGYRVLHLEQFRAEAVSGFFTPNLYAIASAEKVCPEPSAKNDYTPIAEYIADSVKRDKALHTLPRWEGIGYLWGVGAYCERLLESRSLDHLTLAGLIDRDPKKLGMKIHGLEIFAPEILQTGRQVDYILITSVLYEEAIRRELREIGFHGRIEVLK